jgi:hypothetical protein
MTIDYSQFDTSLTKFLRTQVNLWDFNTSWHLLNSYEPQILTQPYIDENMLQCKFIDFSNHIYTLLQLLCDH